MSKKHVVGAELRDFLQGRGCALQEAEARALAILLIDLISEELLAVGESDENCRTCNTAVLNTQKEVIESDHSS